MVWLGIVLGVVGFLFGDSLLLFAGILLIVFGLETENKNGR